jgi:hypothetical protein
MVDLPRIDRHRCIDLSLSLSLSLSLALSPFSLLLPMHDLLFALLHRTSMTGVFRRTIWNSAMGISHRSKPRSKNCITIVAARKWSLSAIVSAIAPCTTLYDLPRSTMAANGKPHTSKYGWRSARCFSVRPSRFAPWSPASEWAWKRFYSNSKALQ